MPENVTCNLCGGRSTRLLYTLRDHRLWVDDEEWSVVQCINCGLGYVNPRPTPSEIMRYYPPEYYGIRAGMAQRYRRQIKYMPEGPARLLEIGAARGDFLQLMREGGWDVVGIEPSQDAGNPHGLEIHRGSFPDSASFPPSSFDVITAWAVFEHLHDPGAAFSACATLLRPGGQLVLQVPNLRSIRSRWARQEDVPRHLYFFSTKTLRAYAEMAGLELERVVHTTEFGGSGRGVLRLAFSRALGRSTTDFFRMYSVPRGERFRRWPVLASACTAISLLERMVLPDWLMRSAHISGQVVAYFSKPVNANATTSEKPAAAAGERGRNDASVVDREISRTMVSAS